MELLTDMVGRLDRQVIALSVAALGLGFLVGRAVGKGNLQLAFILSGAVIGLALFDRLRLRGWCLLLILTAVFSRLVVATVGLPSILNFLHYPIAFAFAFAASQRPRSTADRNTRHASIWMVGLLLVVALSLAANSSHPIRALIFLVIIGEPLLVIWAILRWGVDQRSLDRVLRAGLLMLLFQVPIGLFQGATLGWNDPVQGTLVGHGAGAHVLGGLFALGSLTAAAAVMHGRLRLTAGLALGTVGLGMAFAAGAIQVLIATALGFAALALLGRATPREAGGRVRRSRFSPGMAFAALALAIFGPLLAEAAVPGLFERIQILAQPEQLPEVEMLKTRVDEDLGTFLLGSGPGTTASRASLLLTPQLMKETSPLAFLQIPPTPEALEIASSARVSEAFAGSAEQVASSALGLIGDLGVIGFISAVFLFLRMAHVAKRTGSWLTPAVTGAAVMVLLLIFIDNWIEYPEFAVPLGVVLGLSLSDAAGRPLDEVSVQGFEIRSVSR